MSLRLKVLQCIQDILRSQLIGVSRRPSGPHFLDTQGHPGPAVVLHTLQVGFEPVAPVVSDARGRSSIRSRDPGCIVALQLFLDPIRGSRQVAVDGGEVEVGKDVEGHANVGESFPPSIAIPVQLYTF